MKKITILRTLLILLFVVFMYFYFKPNNYEKHYLVNDFYVVEKYSDKYLFQISNEKYEFNYSFDRKYSPARKLIKEIDVFSEDEYYCIYFEIEDLENIPLCYEGIQLIDFRLIKNQKFIQYLKNKYDIIPNYINKSLNNYTLYLNDETKYAIWNYKGIDFINGKTINTTKLFENDVYESSLLHLANKYLFIPNFIQEYSFDECYIFDLESGDYKLWKMPVSINYESYVLGSFENNIYIVDKKAKVEYELNLFDQVQKIISTNNERGKIYENGWKEITMTKLISNKYSFQKETKIQYVINNQKLNILNKQLNTTTLISEIVDPYIISSNEEEVYYLKDDVMYRYNLKFGETKTLNNYEWKFNFDNKIFIYNSR